MKKLVLAAALFSSICWGDDLHLLIGPDEIAQKVQQVAEQIDKEYAGETVTIVMIMKGSICVTADLMRQLRTSTTLEYVKASSYGHNGSMRGDLTVVGLDKLDLSDKNVLVVDDIFDSGATMETVVRRLQEKNPKSLKSLVLLLKNVPHATDYRPDYVLFEIENHFVIGYGLDYNELYRGLPGIYYFKS